MPGGDISCRLLAESLGTIGGRPNRILHQGTKPAILEHVNGRRRCATRRGDLTAQPKGALLGPLQQDPGAACGACGVTGTGQLLLLFMGLVGLKGWTRRRLS